jgi:hypothetical protein
MMVCKCGTVQPGNATEDATDFVCDECLEGTDDAKEKASKIRAKVRAKRNREGE